MATVLDRPLIPTEPEVAQAKRSLKLLSADKSSSHYIMCSETGAKVPIPETVFNLFVPVLEELSKGNAIQIVPINAEVTTIEAAELIGVSRPFLVKLLNEGKIPYRLVGRHRRILFKDLMEYDAKTRKNRLKALAEMTAEDDVAGLTFKE
jgi:excisionase family DNA binding protein